MHENGSAWVTASRELVAAVRTAEQYLTYVSAGPFQYAVAEALRLPDSYFADFRPGLARKRDPPSTGLRAAGFEVYDPQGTYFITTDTTPSQLRLLRRSEPCRTQDAPGSPSCQRWFSNIRRWHQRSPRQDR